MRHTNLLAASITACLLLSSPPALAAGSTKTPKASVASAHLARGGARRAACGSRAAARARRASARVHGAGQCNHPLRPGREATRLRRVAGFNRTRSTVHGHSVRPADTAQTGVAAIAAVLATPCQNTELTPEEANLELVRQAVLCLINKQRALHGLAPLQLDPRLQAAAEGHSHELVSADYFAHVSPSGQTPVDRVRATGYVSDPSDGWVIGENLAWGTYGLATPQAIVSAWIASPEHLANILEAQYRETGIGVTSAVPPSLGGDAQGATYAQEFGVILH